MTFFVYLFSVIQTHIAVQFTHIHTAMNHQDQGLGLCPPVLRKMNCSFQSTLWYQNPAVCFSDTFEWQVMYWRLFHDLNKRVWRYFVHSNDWALHYVTFFIVSLKTHMGAHTWERTHACMYMHTCIHIHAHTNTEISLCFLLVCSSNHIEILHFTQRVWNMESRHTTNIHYIISIHV